MTTTLTDRALERGERPTLGDSIFPDSMMAVAAIDRLVHHATLMELSGESYRKRAYQRQLQGRKVASSG